jgi:hypothetical protein
MNVRKCEISEAAKLMARPAGIYGNAEARIRRMARRSAPVTSEYGNFRYQEWFMFISEGVVQSITRLEPECN